MSASPWSQPGARVALAHGPREATELVAARVDRPTYAVVVDVLSFSTTVTVAVEAGVTVLPHRWRDDSARALATDRDAVLAVGRSEARAAGPGSVSLSPASVRAALGQRPMHRLVLPSPNGSAISWSLAGGGATVLAGCLRNRRAAGAWLTHRLAQDARACVVVVAAGERWRDDDSLRPALEDLLGAGALVAALLDSGVVAPGDTSPEAHAAAATHRAVAGDVAEVVRSCASGIELRASGFADDVEVAAEVDASTAVPVLRSLERAADVAAFVAG